MDVNLPADVAQMVKEKVASGEYESETDVILEGLRALQARESAVAVLAAHRGGCRL